MQQEPFPEPKEVTDAPVDKTFDGNDTGHYLMSLPLRAAFTHRDAVVQARCHFDDSTDRNIREDHTTSLPEQEALTHRDPVIQDCPRLDNSEDWKSREDQMITLSEQEALVECDSDGSPLPEVLRMLLEGSITQPDLTRFRCFAKDATSAMLFARLYCWEITAVDAIQELLEENYLSHWELTDLLLYLPPMVQQVIEDQIIEDGQSAA
jgi:hypothetical protein